MFHFIYSPLSFLINVYEIVKNKKLKKILLLTLSLSFFIWYHDYNKINQQNYNIISDGVFYG